MKEMEDPMEMEDLQVEEAEEIQINVSCVGIYRLYLHSFSICQP
jgi:hypothetical protein